MSAQIFLKVSQNLEIGNRNGEPDLSYIPAASQAFAPHLAARDVGVARISGLPGHTEERLDAVHDPFVSRASTRDRRTFITVRRIL